MIPPFYIITLNKIKGGRGHFIIVTPQAGYLFFSVCVSTSKTNTHNHFPHGTAHAKSLHSCVQENEAPEDPTLPYVL